MQNYLICISMFLLPLSSLAVVPCAPVNNLVDSQTNVTSHVLKAFQFDDPDRRTAADYAKDHSEDERVIKERYSATGDLSCKDGDSQANVTIAGDVITTSAHSIYGTPACGSNKAKLNGCKFTTNLDGQKQEYEIDEVINTGWVCGAPDLHKAGTDWAVLRLKKKVDPRIKPYKVGYKYIDEAVLGTQVMAVGKSIDWPKDKVLKLADKPRHYGDCVIKGGGNFDFSTVLNSNCDLSPGSSGGALLTRGSDPTLIAIHAGEVKGGRGCPRSNPKKTSGPSNDCWAMGSTAITGDFRDALLEIEKNEFNRSKNPPPREAPPNNL